MPQTRHLVGKILPDDPSSSGHDGSARVPPAPSADFLLPEVYEELRRLAHSRMAELSAGQTLQPTALVHEAYLRLLGKHGAEWSDARHFFLAAARAMHDILVERARQKASIKRGSERRKLDLDNLEIAQETPSPELLALEEALVELERHDARKHQVVLLRFFAGCTADETAKAMSLSLATVERDWRYARAWLHEKLSDDSPSEGGADALRD